MCACFDSDCQCKARCDGRPKSVSLVSDESLLLLARLINRQVEVLRGFGQRSP